MPFFANPKVSQGQRLADYARVLVRAGTLEHEAVVAEVAEAARQDTGADRPVETARRLVDEARGELRVEQESWPSTTDFDSLQAAFAAMRGEGIAVLESVEDHWRANTALTVADEAGERLEGVVWFTAPDIWHAVEHGMLEINVWHGDSANVAEGDELLAVVVGTLAEHGLEAHFDEGRVEISAHWRRRLTDGTD